MPPHVHVTIALIALALLMLSAASIARLVDRVVDRIARRRRPDAAAPPYRTTGIAPVDPVRAENRQLRRALALTRVLAIGPVLLAAGHHWLATMGPVVAPWVEPASLARVPRTLHAGLPFSEHRNRVAAIGTTFDYRNGAEGYQVPMEFSFLPPGDAATATLDLSARARMIPGQTPRTEGIWVDGVLSGDAWPPFRVPSMTLEDLSGRNHNFTGELFSCCADRYGRFTLSLDDLLRGSMLAPSEALADGELQVVVADDVEVLAASLRVCRAPRGGAAAECLTVEARSVTEVGTTGP